MHFDLGFSRRLDVFALLLAAAVIFTTFAAYFE